jgi:hypothetical protein
VENEMVSLKRTRRKINKYNGTGTGKSKFMNRCSSE